MDGRHFDTLTRGLLAGASRRAAFGGLLGGALALLTGASVLEARKGGKGKGKGKGKGRGKGKGKNRNNNKRNGKGKGKGKGRTKVTFCHRDGNDGFNLITVGGPAAKAHRKHDDVLCGEPGVCQTGTATGCDEEGACTFDLAEDGTACEIDGVAGTCDAEGACVPTEEPPVEE